MRVHTALFALAASTLATSPTTYFAHGRRSSRFVPDASYEDKDSGHSSSYSSDRRSKHDDHGGADRDLRDSGHGSHDTHNERHNEHKGSSGNSHDGRHHGGGSRGNHRGGNASGTRVTSRSGGRRVKHDGRMHVQCSPPDKRSEFVVDMVECYGDCCDDEDYCGEFVMNLGDHVPCLTEDSEDGDWDYCDFQLTLPEKALSLDTTCDDREYRIRITDSNDEDYESCSPAIDIAPADDPTAAPTTEAPTTAAPTTAAPTTPAPTMPEEESDLLIGGTEYEPVVVRGGPAPPEPTPAPTPCVETDDDEGGLWASAPTCPS